MLSDSENWRYRVRGTFLEISTPSFEEDKEKVQKRRSRSAPPIAIADAKKWHSNHTCVTNSALSKSDHIADGIVADVVDEQTRGNNQLVEYAALSLCEHLADAPYSNIVEDEQNRGDGRQCLCCGDPISVCACGEGFYNAAGVAKAFSLDESPGRSFALAEQKDTEFADGVPNFLLDGETPGANPAGSSGLAEETDEQCADDVMPAFTGSTVMLCNIPCRIGRHDIVKALEAYDFAGTYNFIHLPKGKIRRYRRYGNIGYTFIDFISSEAADKFAEVFEDFQFPGIRSTKKCKVKLAHMPGFNAKAPALPGLLQVEEARALPGLLQ
jgi:hypothetical protein